MTLSVLDIGEFAPDCPYCGQRSEPCDGTLIYPRRADLYDKLFFICSSCWAYVGVHRDSGKPLGRLANAELRRAKQEAHTSFDRLWIAKMRKDGVSKGEARRAAYRWLGEALHIKPEDCHIGMMDVADCRRVVAACSPYLRSAA